MKPQRKSLICENQMIVFLSTVVIALVLLFQEKLSCEYEKVKAL